jgi:hypothetical protein
MTAKARLLYLFGRHSQSLMRQFSRLAAENEPVKEQHIGENNQRRYCGDRIADRVT